MKKIFLCLFLCSCGSTDDEWLNYAKINSPCYEKETARYQDKTYTCFHQAWWEDSLLKDYLKDPEHFYGSQE